MSDIDRFLDQQRTGAHDSEGVFTLDPARARDKLRLFQLPSPEFAWLKIVQAAVAWKADRLVVKSTNSKLLFELHGQFDAGDMRRWIHLFAAPLEADPGPAQHLAMGCMGALQMASEIEWSYDREGRHWQMKIDQHHIRIADGPASGRPATLKFTAPPAGGLSVLARRCQFCPIPIIVNGASIFIDEQPSKPYFMELVRQENAPFMSVTATSERHMSLSDRQREIWVGRQTRTWRKPIPPRSWLAQYQGVAPVNTATTARWRANTVIRIPGTSADMLRLSKLRLVVDGVTLPPIALELPYGAEIVSCNPKLSLDISGFSVVRNKALETFKSELRRDLDVMVCHLRLHQHLIPPLPASVLTSKDGLPRVFGPWLLLESLPGDSPMGRFRAVPARGTNLWEEVVLTTYPRERALFEQRVSELSGCKVPGLHPILAQGEVDGDAYTVESIPVGTPLSLLTPMEIEQGRETLIRIARRTLQLHETGLLLLYRIIPENIIINFEEITFLDAFGRPGLDMRNANALQYSTRAAAWKAPDELNGRPGAAADQYRLGLAGFFIFTGQHPLDTQGPAGDNFIGMLYKHLHTPSPDPRELRPELPDPLAEAILRALQKNPDDRFPSIADFLNAIIS